MNTTATHYTVLGCNDEQTTCDHCGRTGLKKTVVLRDDEGDIVRFGTSCAITAQAVPGVRTKAQMDRVIIAAENRLSQARDMLAAWSRYVLADGTVDADLFSQRNRIACEKFNWTRSEISERVLRVVAEQRAILAEVAA